MLDNGSEIDIPFQDGDVQIPILSVKDFVRKDSVVRFKHNGGTIKLPSGSRMTFVEKYGVYFICLNVTSGNIDGNHSSEQHLNSIHAIERAIDVLDPKHLAVEDAMLQFHLRPMLTKSDVDVVGLSGDRVLPGRPESSLDINRKPTYHCCF